MAKRIKDTDYLFLSTRIHVMERSLLSRERMERMLEAATNEEAAKVLVECGYPEMSTVDVDSVNNALAYVRDKVFEDLYASVPDPRMIDVFKVKYDYHNVKTLLKSTAMGVDPARLMVSTGRYDPAELTDKIRSGSFSGIPDSFARAIREAQEVLGATRDPQLSDFVLDRAYFKELTALAEGTGSTFLLGYVKLMIDAANLRSLVRVRRMGKSEAYLKNVLFEGGKVTVSSILRLASDGDLASVYGTTSLAKAAEAGQSAVKGGGLTTFERECDNAVMNYVAGAKYVAFGDATVIGYLVAKDSELTAVRIIMTGRLAGLKADTIRERLREAYV